VFLFSSTIKEYIDNKKKKKKKKSYGGVEGVCLAPTVRKRVGARY